MNLHTEQKISLIVLTRNRHDYLNPLLRYYSAYPLNLVIADGSDRRYEGGLEQEALDSESKDPLFTVTYIHDSSPDSYTKRLRRALSLVPAGYVAVAPDDELLIWTGLCQAAKDLDLDCTLASAGGSSTICKVVKSHLAYVGYLNYGFSEREPWYVLNSEDLSICSDDAFMRCVKIIQTPLLHRFHFYRLFRQSALLHGIELWDLVKTESGLADFAITLGVHLEGKSKFSDYPFWIRTLMSNHGEGNEFGKYPPELLTRIASRIMHDLKEKEGFTDSHSVHQELNDLLKLHLGQSSALVKTLNRYTDSSRPSIQKKLWRMAIKYLPTDASLSLINFRFSTKFAFDYADAPRCGFTSTLNEQVSFDLHRASEFLRHLLLESY